MFQVRNIHSLTHTYTYTRIHAHTHPLSLAVFQNNYIILLSYFFKIFDNMKAKSRVIFPYNFHFLLQYKSCTFTNFNGSISKLQTKYSYVIWHRCRSPSTKIIILWYCLNNTKGSSFNIEKI